jgi:hypothetical protein
VELRAKSLYCPNQLLSVVTGCIQLFLVGDGKSFSVLLYLLPHSCDLTCLAGNFFITHSFALLMTP